MTRINLLPWRDIRRKELDRQVLTAAAGAWIIMGLVVFYAHLHVTGLIEGQQRRNDFLDKEIKKVDDEIKEIKELQAARAALLARMRVIQQLQSDRTQVVHMFDDLVRKMPEGVHLFGLKQVGQQLTLSGNAQSNARVSALMRNLDASDWFTAPELEVINIKLRGTERVSEFVLRVKQAAKTEKDEAKADKKKAGP